MAGPDRQVAGWGGRSAANIWRDSSGLLQSFPFVEDPVLLPVYLAFFVHYLGGWAPFGACRGCLPLCRSPLLPRPAPPEAASGLFCLGMLAVAMRMRMYPRRMWRLPPPGLFLVYKFVISLFIFEISHSCIFRAVERTLYEGMPAACEAMIPWSIYLDLDWLLEAVCSLFESDWVLWLGEYSMAGAFLWCALSAARFNSLAQLQAHPLLALAASAAVVYKARSAPHCGSAVWG